MRISVIIPSYNHSMYIEEAIRSVFIQARDGLDVELIIVDDGSLDRSLEVIRSCLRNHPLRRAMLIEQSNRGAHAAIMRGLEHASGDLLAILNSDDAFLPGRFDALASRLDATNDSIGFTLVEMIDENDQPLKPDAAEFGWYQDVLASAVACPTRGFALLRNNPAVTSGNFVFSRSLYDKLGGFSEHRLSHDWDFLLRATYFTEPIFIPEVLMRYRVHPENTTTQVQHLMAKEGREGLNRFMALAREGPSPNPLAPLPANWPRYWPWFCQSIRPHFIDQPILETIDPALRPPRHPDPNLQTRSLDALARTSQPKPRTDPHDPRVRESTLMTRATPTTDGMDLNMTTPPPPSPEPRPRAVVRDAIKRFAPEPLLHLARRAAGKTPTTIPPSPGPHTPPDQLDVHPDQPLVLIVTHEMSRTGAPLVALELVRRFSADTQCAVIYADEGPLAEDFAAHAWLIDGRQLNPWGTPSRYGRDVLGRLGSARQRWAICNTATTWYYARWLKRAGWRTISLIHDFATNSPRDDFAVVASSADTVVYPCTSMRQLAQRWAQLPDDHGLVLPQGLLREDFLEGDARPARQALRQRLGIPEDAIVALGCGSLELRKGPELFTLAALAALRSEGTANLHFVWVGTGADTYLDPTFWCPRDVERSGFSDRIHFIGEMDDTEEAFRGSDLFLLTSREDPFPCVVHEAMACGLPVACFEHSGGSPEILADGGGRVVPFGEVESLGKVVARWCRDPDMRQREGARGRDIVRNRFTMTAYVEALRRLGLQGTH